MNDPKITLGMIVRDSLADILTLESNLKAISKFVDQINITITTVEDSIQCKPLKEILSGLKVNVSQFKWVNDFSAARNFNLSQCQTELYLWLDADDILEGVQNISILTKKFKDNNALNAIWMNYDYDFDKSGNCICKLRRERIVRTKFYKWVGKLHENLLCKFAPVIEYTDLCNVKHQVSHSDLEIKANRNLDVILGALDEERERKEIDARTVYDVARAYQGVGNLNEALAYFEQFIKITGSQLDLYDALIRMCGIYRSFGMLGKTVAYAHDAILRYHNRPEAYLELAECAYLEEKWSECVHWVDISIKQRIENDILPINPTNLLLRPMKLKQDCLFRMNHPKEALKLVVEALKISKDDAELLKAKENIEDFLDYRDAELGAIRILKRLEKKNETDKIKHLIEGIPDELTTHPFFVKLRNQYNPKSGKNKIIIYCHESYEDWDGSSSKEGIGGSEEAVINISRELVKLGWTVEVYNSCKNPGIYDGVIYNYYDQYDRTQPCDVFIAWRLCEWVSLAPEGALKILWCHDKQEIVYFSPDIIEKTDKIFVLSAYHRLDLPEIPDDKFHITRNGINPDDFKGNWVEKKKNSFIYASSPDRGLIHILENWDRIVEQAPDCELHIFYGFNRVYDKLMEGDPQRRVFKDRVMELINKYDNVFYHGKVGHKEIAQAFMKADYWLYPTDWEEISCITAMKAQAAGCWPICNDFAALAETVQFGTVTKGETKDEGFMDRYVESFKIALEESSQIQRKAMREWSLTAFSWETLANGWNNKFKEWIKEKNKITVLNDHVSVK